MTSTLRVGGGGGGGGVKTKMRRYRMSGVGDGVLASVVGVESLFFY